MATRKSTAAVLDEELDIPEVEAEVEAEPTEKALINDAIARVVEATGIDVQKNRYKAMRAIAFQAFSNAIADGTFDDLVDEAIANVDTLPTGWEIERTEKVEAKAPAKPVVAKAPVKKAAVAKAAPAKVPTPRRRPAR